MAIIVENLWGGGFMPRQSLNDTLVVSKELEDAYKTCIDLLSAGELNQLGAYVLLYEQILYGEITCFFGAKETPIIFDPQHNEIHPEALSDFRQVMDAYIAGLAMFTIAAMEHNSELLLARSNFHWSSDVFCLWELGLKRSCIEDCILSQEELMSRFLNEREKEEQIAEKIQARARRHKYLLITAQVGGIMAGFLLPGGALTLIAGRIVINAAVTGGLNAAFVTVDNVASGEEELHKDVSGAALTGVATGAIGATIGEGFSFLVGKVVGHQVASHSGEAIKSATQQRVATESGKSVAAKTAASAGARKTANFATSTVPSNSAVVGQGGLRGSAEAVVTEGGKGAFQSVASTGSNSVAEQVLKPQKECMSSTIEKAVQPWLSSKRMHEPMTAQSDSLSKEVIEIQVLEKEEDTLFSLLINSERIVLSYLNTLVDFPEEALRQQERRLENILNLFKEKNAQKSEEIEREVIAFEQRVEKTYVPVSNYEKLTETMADWSCQYLVEPQKCSLGSLARNTDLEGGLSLVAVTPSKEKKWVKLQAAEKDRERKSKPLKERIEILLAACQKEEKSWNALLNFQEKNDLSQDYRDIQANERSYISVRDELEPQMESWMKWQEKVAGYIKLAGTALNDLSMQGEKNAPK